LRKADRKGPAQVSASQSSAERSFQSARSAPREVAVWFRGVAQSAGLASEDLDRAELCLDELVTNVVRHGGDGARSVTFTVSARRKAREFLVVVEDDGPAFDPLQVPAPVFASSLDQAEAGGRGVFLIRSIADELRYERGNGRNRVTIVFRLEG
jgi:serine/threonine-protein kinase RsbW